jgi:hypothetical protein
MRGKIKMTSESRRSLKSPTKRVDSNFCTGGLLDLGGDIRAAGGPGGALQAEGGGQQSGEPTPRPAAEVGVGTGLGLTN